MRSPSRKKCQPHGDLLEVCSLYLECPYSRHEVWGTIGVSPNIIEASWKAMVDALDYKLAREGVLPRQARSRSSKSQRPSRHTSPPKRMTDWPARP